MTTPKLTQAQLEALKLAFPKIESVIRKSGSTREPWAFAFEDDACTPYIGKQLESKGMVVRARLSTFPFMIQLQLTDTGLAALRGE